MDKKIKARWVKALRSGKYKQGTGRLLTLEDNDTPKYCCLGVLCKVMEEPIPTDRGILPMKFARRVHVLPNGRLFDISSEFSYFGVEGTTLAELNDSGLSFKRIANLIEKYL